MIVTFRVLEHPRASVTLQVHVPAVRAFAEALLCTGVVFQLKAYGAVPPLAVIVALPVLAPKQVTLVCALRVLDSTMAGCVIGTLRVVEHPLLSVTVHVHVPAARPVAVALFCGGVVFQLKVYGAVPPVAATVADPVAPPKQATCVELLRLVDSADVGPLIKVEVVLVHPYPLVIVA